MESQKGLMTIKQASEYLQIKVKTLYAWAESGDIPHYKLGRLIRFKKSDIDSWLEEHRKAQDKSEVEHCAKKILKTTRKSNFKNPEKIIRKIIDEVKGKCSN